MLYKLIELFMKRYFLFIPFICLVLSVSAQVRPDSLEIYKIADPISLGIGLGQNFGGIGGKLLIYPQQNIGFFGGLGYAMAGVGYNVGTKVRFFSKKNPRTNFYLTGMYGYNATVTIKNENQYNKIFYGPTFGFGIDTGKRSYKKGYWTMALLFPFRDAEVDDYFDDLEDNHGVKFENSLLPFTFSFGYHFALN